MKKVFGDRQLILVVMLGLFSMIWSCQKKESAPLKIKEKSKKVHLVPALSNVAIDSFFVKYPDFRTYKKQVLKVYKKHEFQFIWQKGKERNEAAIVINDKIKSIKEEGMQTEVPYTAFLNTLLQNTFKKPNKELDLLLTSSYLYYTSKVFEGIDSSLINDLGWYLPKKSNTYINYLDSLLVNPKIFEKPQLIGQYYRLKEGLKKYRAIAARGGWKQIVPDSLLVSLKPGDTSTTIGQIRSRLCVTGELATDSKSDVYDGELRKGILKYKYRNGFTVDDVVLEKHINTMNVPVRKRIKTIIVNMERLRWISKEDSESKELIVVNIPSFRLTYFKAGEVVLVSNVVVGTDLNRTVIFSGMMSNIVFSPYWNVPQSIIKKEILPAMKTNKDYLEQHNMEWNKGKVRQKPGPKNSLGLVKFLFPNSNNIYLHDTPSKWLFSSETRTFSHGCIRVAKPKELARLILENDSIWTPKKIDAAMNKGKETWYKLKEKIPVYIGYFTTWVDENGNVSFYRDIYNRDQQLEDLLMKN